MKKLLFINLVIMSASCGHADNLLNNGTFEDVANNSIAGWHCGNYGSLNLTKDVAAGGGFDLNHGEAYIDNVKLEKIDMNDKRTIKKNDKSFKSASTTGDDVNLLKNINTSFEAGMRGCMLAAAPWELMMPRFSDTASDGQRSLIIAPGERCVTTMIPVKLGQRYQWSFDLRSQDEQAVIVKVSAATAFIEKNKLKDPVFCQKNVNITSEWRRYSIEFDVPAASACPPWVYLKMEIPRGKKQGTVLTDAFRMSSVSQDVAAPLPYLPSNLGEASISTPDSIFSVFDHSGPIQIEIALSNPDSIRSSLIIRDILYGTEYKPSLKQTNTGHAAVLTLPVGMFQADATISADKGEYHVYRTIAVADHRALPANNNPLGGHFAVGDMQIKRAHWLGFKSLRLFWEKTNWDCVEPERGRFVFPADKDVNEAVANGFDVLVVLGYGVRKPPKWLDAIPSGKGEWGWQQMVPKPQEMHCWQEYVRAMAEHYRGKVKYWEIINEPNGIMQAKDYLPMLKTAYNAIKEVDPQMQVIGICSTWDYKVDGFKFVEECLEQGAAQYLDIISLHPYTWPKSPEERNTRKMFQRVHDLMDKYAPKTKLWCTEWSYVSPVLEPGRPVTQVGADISDPFDNSALQVAAYFVRTALIHLAAGCERTYVLDVFSQSAQHGHAPYRGAGMTWIDYDNTVLPSYLAWHELSRHAVGSTFEKYLPLPEKLCAQLWQIGGGRKELILWRNDRKTSEININKSLIACDIFGRRIKPSMLTDMPVYVTGNAAEIDKFAEEMVDKLKEPSEKN